MCKLTSPLWGITSYGITHCYLPPGRGDFLTFPQLKLVLDLATLKGCKAELTWVVVISQDGLPTRDGYQKITSSVMTGIRTHEPQVRHPNYYTTEPPALYDCVEGMHSRACFFIPGNRECANVIPGIPRRPGIRKCMAGRQCLPMGNALGRHSLCIDSLPAAGGLSSP